MINDEEEDDRTYRSYRRSETLQRAPRRTERMTADDSEEDPGWRRERAAPRSRAARPRSAQTATLKLPVSGQEFQRWLQAGGWRYLAGIIAVMLLLLITGMVFQRGSENATAAGRPQADGTATVGPLGTVSPLLALYETATAQALMPTPSVRAFTVSGTGGAGLFLRPAASRNGDPLATLPDGSRVEQAGEDVTDGGDPGLVWRQVRTADGRTGFVAAQFLVPVP
jgi:hypothetical protein